MGTASVINEIAIERLSHEAKGYTADHDAEHGYGELASAAAAYAKTAAMRLQGRQIPSGPPSSWPWEAAAWKPRTWRDDLIRAAALIVAAIECIEDASFCIVCTEQLAEGDAYYPAVSGGFLHAACCGPERECYVNLETGEAIPTPEIWSGAR
jgi:hypothetical protein